MDGVTDAAFRYIVAQHGKSDVQYTEFVSVDEISRGTASAWRQLRFLDIERPVLAQIYGTDPAKFYQAAHIVCTLGFDGVDINMGCPAKSVSARGCGAALINTPHLAQEIIRAVQAGVRDWASGQTLAHIGLNSSVVEQVQQYTSAGSSSHASRRHPIPVSVKTRLGYDTVVVEDWVSALLETQPEVITLHGRTLTQLYRGQADWEAIRRAAKLARETSTLMLGNGDIHGMDDVRARVQATHIHGVLIGRGALGNPWVFRDKGSVRRSHTLGPLPAPRREVSVAERLRVALEHARYFASLPDGGPFVAMRKHLGWYCRGFAGAAEVRTAMFKTNTVEDVERVFDSLYSRSLVPD